MKNKLLFIITFLGLLHTSTILAQTGGTKEKKGKKGGGYDMMIGAQAGLNDESISGSNTWASGGKIGFDLGGNIQFTKDKLAFEGDLLYHTAAYATSSNNVLNTSVTVNVTSLSIPLLVKYSFYKTYWAEIGPQYSSILSVSNNDKNYFKSSNMELVLGVQKILNHHWSLGLRYGLGLSDLDSKYNNVYSDSWKTTSIKLYASYRIM